MVCVVFLTTSFKSPKDNFLLMSANNEAPRAPTPEASVGVAIPINILPSTAIIKSEGGIIDLNTENIISNVTGFAFLGAGATFGFAQA